MVTTNAYKKLYHLLEVQITSYLYLRSQIAYKIKITIDIEQETIKTIRKNNLLIYVINSLSA